MTQIHLSILPSFCPSIPPFIHLVCSLFIRPNVVFSVNSDELIELYVKSISNYLTLSFPSLFLQLSRSCNAAVLLARWTDGSPHRWLQGRPLHGNVPRAAQLPGSDSLPGHNVSIWTYSVLFGYFEEILMAACRRSYCSPEYTFPRQQEVISFAASRAFELVTLHPRTLVVCGSYSVGKEKVFLGMWFGIFFKNLYDLYLKCSSIRP